MIAKCETCKNEFEVNGGETVCDYCDAFEANEKMIVESARRIGILSEEEDTFNFGIKFIKGDRVQITDGYAYVGALATVEDVSKDWNGIVAYKLKEISGWWPQSSLREANL